MKEWVSGLKISSEKYESWLREAPAGESLTYWCLQSGRLNEAEYLGWAREFYCLPSLNSEFFRQPPRHDLWKSIQSVANWSAALFPIAEWDGVIYIACVEPLHETPWSFPVQFVLAPALEMKKFWQSLVVTEERSFAGIPPTPDKQITGVHLLPQPDAETSQVEVDTPPEADAPPPLTQENSAPVDEPAGLDLSAFKVQSSSKERDYMSELATAVSAAPQAPEGFATPDNEIPSSPFNDDATLAPEGMNVQKASTSPQGLSVPQEMPAPEIKTSAAEPTNDATSESTVVRHFHTQFLASVVAKFSGAMIIEISQSNFVPLIWNESFRPVGPEAKKVWNLNPPSAFRIAYRTGQPYLGHIVETPLNTEFFKAWGFDNLPKCILVQPVKNSAGAVDHLLLCLADEQKRSHHLLTEAQKLADEFAATFAGQKSAA